ncbi:MAG: AAA family ATPase [Nanoarchaeota archaeon]|nr:AAA family ATPase [Nanoarchaeota archaeon]MBU1644268.1 AAA family ATPase [Nanoarchaeota archaeon]MBU1976990.1 AAA family ATPase [Nanoarchaeota archaeon]
MEKSSSEDEIVYSETIDLSNVEEENKYLTQAINKLEEENKVISNTLNKLEQESSMLRELFNNVNNELNNLKKPALLVSEVVSIKDDKAIVKLPNGNKFYCYVSQDVEGLNSGDAALVDQKSLNIVQKLDVNENFEVEKYIILEKPKEEWKSIGGLKDVIQEVREVIELPLKKPELFEKIGINPPKGILLYGPPGTGKTLLAKAAARSTDATFIEVVGSELVQKFIGEGAKLVKDIFALARRKAPTIVFIDEIDALASKRMETGTSGEREVNRTFMQLLAELDGFKHLGNVKIIGATNRKDMLDTAIIRPGRLDRIIEVGLPDEEGRLEILKVHTANMSLEKIKKKELVNLMGGFSGADIRAVCTEAGYFAIREERSSVTHEDFLMAIDKVYRDEEDDEESGFFG